MINKINRYSVNENNEIKLVTGNQIAAKVGKIRDDKKIQGTKWRRLNESNLFVI